MRKEASCTNSTTEKATQEKQANTSAICRSAVSLIVAGAHGCPKRACGFKLACGQSTLLVHHAQELASSTMYTSTDIVPLNGKKNITPCSTAC